MTTVDIVSVYDEFLDYLAEQTSPEAILAFRASESAQARAELLTEKNKLGQLSQDEAAELEQMIRFNRLVTLLKAKALRKLE
jgi:hypothetical protein